MGDKGEGLLGKNKAFGRSISHAYDELHSFRSCLKWVCVDQSNAWRVVLSWTTFLLLNIVVPVLSHFYLACPSCDDKHRRPYDGLVQLSLTVVASLSFFSLSAFVNNYGLRRLLFFDKLCNESEKVRGGYTAQLDRSRRILSIFVLPVFAAESAYKIWWYASGGTRIPFMGNVYASDAFACVGELCSWLYRTSIFFLVCILFRLVCSLQILRLEDFDQVFHSKYDVRPVLKEHLRIRKDLRIISHRFRLFIVLTLIIVTASQLAALLMTTRHHADVNLYKAGELALCSTTLVIGLGICLRSATKITHKAQAITCFAAKWHVSATINYFDPTDGETPTAEIAYSRSFPVSGSEEPDDDEPGDGDDDLDNTKLVPLYTNTISFQERQALVTYFENNRAGISLFGFLLDRTCIQLIFGIELSLVLWLLGKTVGIS